MHEDDIVKAVQVLVYKSKELDLEKISLRERVQQIDEDSISIEQAIHALDSSYSPQKFRYRKTQKGYKFFKHGECQGLVLKIIRDSAVPIGSSSIVKKIMSDKGFDDSQSTYKSMFSTVSYVIKNLETRGLIIEMGIGNDGLSRLWSIVE